MNITVEEFLTRKIFNDLEKNKITERHITEIEKILNVYNNKSIKNRLNNIYTFLKYDVEGDWVERLNIIVDVLKLDNMSDYAIEIRYGKNNIGKVKETFKTKFSHSLEIYKEKYGSEGEEKYEEYKFKSKTPWGLKSCIEKYGEDDGKLKWEERLSKKTKTQKERKFIKPYVNGRTLVEYQTRYGADEGYEKWKERNRKQSYRFSKKYFIDNFGGVIGVEKWTEYKKTMVKTSLNSFIERYGETVGLLRYDEFVLRNIELLKTKPNFSLSSQNMFNKIIQTDNFDKNKVYFATNNGEYMFYISKESDLYGVFRVIQVDFKFGDKIIEFDGDYWHSKIKQIEKDKLRDEFLVKKGYNVLRIKESDYTKNKEETVNKCINFLKE